MTRTLNIPAVLCFIDMDEAGWVLYAPEHIHTAGDDLPCSASILMVL